MSDADSHYNHGPLQPAAPDPWHDRGRLPVVPVWFSIALIALGLVFWVLS